MILVTGSSGFVGAAIIKCLADSAHEVRASSRHKSLNLPDNVDFFNSGDLGTVIDWRPALNQVDVVIHTAARVHIMNDDISESLTEFRRINTLATLNLARQASQAGIKRFIYISSVKVNGEMTESNKPFTPDDQFVPDDPYGLSKYEAEQGLLALSKETGMEVVIIRPPLVYGPGVRANFASMLKWVDRGVPLPFGAINNQRSLVGLDNLVSFIIHCIDHPEAANEVFLISDGEDLSTTELLRKVAKSFGKQARLIPVAVSWMTFAAKLVGKEAVANRLFGSLQLDISKATNLLGWKPVITMEQQLQKTAETYLNKPHD